MGNIAGHLASVGFNHHLEQHFLLLYRHHCSLLLLPWRRLGMVNRRGGGGRRFTQDWSRAGLGRLGRHRSSLAWAQTGDRDVRHATIDLAIGSRHPGSQAELKRGSQMRAHLGSPRYFPPFLTRKEGTKARFWSRVCKKNELNHGLVKMRLLLDCTDPQIRIFPRCTHLCSLQNVRTM